MKKLLVILCFWVFTEGYGQNKPNIIFILADDLGYMDLGCYGNPFNSTPHLDSLARGGIRFTQAYAASPVCSPSRAAIMTGKHPARLNLTNFLVGERTDSLSPVLPAVWKKSLPAAELTLAERLKALGYQTGMVGKWHLGAGEGETPWGQGFDYTRLINKNGLDYYNYNILEKNNKVAFTDNGMTYMTDKLSDYALDFVENRSKEQPFFLYLTYSAPHVFIVPRADKVSKYLLKYEKFNGKYNPYYGAMIESMDDGIGRIMRSLKEQGLLDNTLIVFASDNGGVGLPELGPIPTTSDPLRKWKGHIYEGGIRVPTIMFWKGTIPAQKTCDQYFMNTDYVPTFLEMLGQKPAELSDGKSIWQVIKAPEKTLDRGALYWHYPHFSNQMGRPAGAMRLGDWKLVENYETHALELFNLKDDLSEAHNVAQKNPIKTKEMHKMFTAWRQSVSANMPVAKVSKKL